MRSKCATKLAGPGTLPSSRDFRIKSKTPPSSKQVSSRNDLTTMESPNPAFLPATPPRADVDEILSRKRKAREYKACYPCRQRKVKCDQNVPCKTCVVREHPELCTYHPPSEPHPPAKRIQPGPSLNGKLEHLNSLANHTTGGTVTVAREDWDGLCAKLNSLERALAELRGSFRCASDGNHHISPNGYSPPPMSMTPNRPTLDSTTGHVSTEGIHTRNELTGETVHIGGSSVPALVMALGRGNKDGPGAQEILGKSILPIFGLDNESATYPFVDLWGLPHGSMARVNELCRAIPNDSDCLSFFRYYKDMAHVLYPALVDMEKFESDLFSFLVNRVSFEPNIEGDNGVNEQTIYGKSIVWVGLLFAALASGCQCSGLPRKERELSSQVFVCCSFECLKFTNFLSYSTLESIQTLLILGNVISNNMNAGVAWSLLGLTIRLAQSLGLHKACPASTPLSTKIVRSKVWWAVIWQDSLLSVTYDRATAATSLDRPLHFPPGTSSNASNKRYDECMYRLARVGLDIVRERAQPQNSNEALQRITEHKKELQEIMYEAADYLKDSRRCRSIRDQLEHWALYLHMSYITSELCRPAISPSTAEFDLSRTVRRTCIDNLANTVEAFLGLQNVTSFASRSWAAMHRSLSSALLLGILGEPAKNERARNLLHKFITVLSDIASTVDPAELSAPITRSISALRKLTYQETKPPDPVDNTSSGPHGAPSSSGYIPDNIDRWNFDDASVVLTSPLIGHDLEHSPYAMMDSILWGAKRTPSVS